MDPTMSGIVSILKDVLKPLVSVNVTLFGNRLFAGRIKLNTMDP